jgi:23S rRNA pseudouridine1911/1915/1917 synthase
MTQITVTEDHNKQRLDVFITKYFDFIPSRSFAQKLVLNQKVVVDNKFEKPSYLLKTNQVISVDCSFLTEMTAEPVGEKIPLTILFEDEHLIVINKSAGMVVHPGAGVSSGTLVNAILAHCGQTLPSLGAPHRAGIVHRLDRDTSGVLVVAKSQLALTSLSQQFADHSQQRIYQTLVYGTPSVTSQKLENWHGRDPRNRIKFSVQPEGVGKKAILNYSVKESLASKLCSLVECQLYTGRTHQIRVQMANIKHGIIGDALYASIPSNIKNNKPLYSYLTSKVLRQMLHATSLQFKHPATKDLVFFSAPPPPDFQITLDYLRTVV